MKNVLKTVSVSVAAIVLAAALASPASAQRYQNTRAYGGSSVVGGQSNGSEAGPGAGVAGSFTTQSSNVYAGSNAYADRNNAQGTTWGNGSATGLTVSGSLGNAATGAEGGSDYSADTGYNARSRRGRR